jgi:hypothetical protein
LISKLLRNTLVEEKIEIQKDMVKWAMDQLRWYLMQWENWCKETDTILNNELIEYRKELENFIFLNDWELGV